MLGLPVDHKETAPVEDALHGDVRVRGDHYGPACELVCCHRDDDERVDVGVDDGRPEAHGVTGRTRWGGDDDAVGAELGGEPSVDVDLELPDLPDGVGVDHGLVHGGFELLAVVVGVELEALLDGELPADEAGETLLDVVDIDLRQEADASRVDTHDGGGVAHSRA